MLNEHSKSSHLSFPNKCLSLPVVNTTCFWLNTNYNRLKDANPLTKYTIGLAESTFITSIQMASPIVEKFKDKVGILDEMACNQLNRLEVSFPIIKQEPNEIMNNGKEYLNKKVKPAIEKFNELKSTKDRFIKNLELKKEEYDRMVLQTTLKLLDLTEKFIKNNFQESFKPDTNLLEQSCDTSDSVVKRAKLITNMLYIGIQRKCIKQVNHLIKAVDKYLVYFIKILEFADKQKDLTIRRVCERVQAFRNLTNIYKQYLQMISKQLMVQDGRSIYSVDSLEEKTKIVIRRSLGNIQTAFYLICSRLDPLPISFQLSLAKFSEDFANFCIYYTKNMQKISDQSLIGEFKSLLTKAEIVFCYMMKNFSESPMISQMVPNFNAIGVIDECFDDDLICEQSFPQCQTQADTSQSTSSPVNQQPIDSHNYSSSNMELIPNEFFGTINNHCLMETTKDQDESELPESTSSLNSSRVSNQSLSTTESSIQHENSTTEQLTVTSLNEKDFCNIRQESMISDEDSSSSSRRSGTPNETTISEIGTLY